MAQENTSHLVNDIYHYKNKFEINKIRLLMMNKNINQFNQSAQHHKFIHQAHRQYLQNQSQELNDILQLGYLIQQRRHNLDQEQLKLTNLVARLNQEKEFFQNEIADLESHIHGDKLKITQSQQKEVKLNQQLKEIYQNLKDIVETGNLSTIEQSKGKLLFPISHITTEKDYLLSSYSNQHGLHLKSDEGEPIQVIYHGQVVFAQWLKGLGLLTIVDHGHGYMSLYANNRKLLKQPGDWVESGEIIAEVGASGNYSQPGLYFELRKDGLPTNSWEWFSERG